MAYRAHDAKDRTSRAQAAEEPASFFASRRKLEFVLVSEGISESGFRRSLTWPLDTQT